MWIGISACHIQELAVPHQDNVPIVASPVIMTVMEIMVLLLLLVVKVLLPACNKIGVNSKLGSTLFFKALPLTKN